MNHKIGLMGFGVVGQGYHAIAQGHDENLLPFKIVIKNKEKSRPSNLPFVFSAEELINEAEIGIELISDSDVAYSTIKALLEKGKKVITANKKVVAAHLPELIALQHQYGGTLLYEAAVAASIPVLCNLQTQFLGDGILEIKGILNGSSNYILSQIFHNNLTLNEALALAQAEGYAEADPSFDINGSDVASKLTILIAHAFDEFHPERTIPYYGIENIGKEEIDLVKELGLTIKLIASAERTEDGVKAYILPTLIDSTDAISAIDWEYNCIQIKSRNLGEQFFKGKGAGSLPTGAAVFSDLVKSIDGFKYQYGQNIKENTRIESSSTKLTLILRTKAESTFKKYNFKEEEVIATQNANWYVGSFGTDFILKYKEDMIQDGISIINVGETVSGNVLKECLLSFQNKTPLPAE